MNLSEYCDYFHDGRLINFKHIGNKIEISILSAEIIPEEILRDMPPLNNNRIEGKIHFENVKNIKINNEIYTDSLIKNQDSGSVLDFEITQNKVVLGIE